MGRTSPSAPKATAANAAPAVAGYNFRRLLARPAALWRIFIIAPLAAASDVDLAPPGDA